jgi:hypothetical protein
MTRLTKEGTKTGVWQDPDSKLFFGVFATKEGQLLELTAYGYESEEVAEEVIEGLVIAAYSAFETKP